MRIGTNPLKHKASLPAYKRHRIIVPVYIPSNDGYFASATEIFRLSLQSLLATIDPDHVSITIIDNGCVAKVETLLRQTFEEGRIDRLILNAKNRGKPDAVASELLASYEPFVTLADSDVLFLHGWLAAIEELFKTWPSAGAASPIAQPAPFYSNDTTWTYGVLTGQLRRGKFVSNEDMLQFAHSVGKPSLYSHEDLGAQFALSRSGIHALVGGGHFVITLRRRCYVGFDYRPRLEGTGHGMRSIDAPVDTNGWLRLSTTKAHVLHMGNTPEPWMQKRVDEQLAAPFQPLDAGDAGNDVALREKGTGIPRPLAVSVGYVAKIAARALKKLKPNA